MIEFSTLGSLALTGIGPERAEPLLRQPKRLALLAYLSARAPGTLASRERAMAVFWPEQPADRANGSLRNALYFIRRCLGPGALVSRGRHVGTDPSVVRCDAAELLTDGSLPPAELLERYGGEFLAGVHVADAPDFERWTDRTRASLRARAVALAWSLSEEAERRGEWISAATYARGAAELAVDVEGAVQRLIGLLDRAGDRAAALAAYDRLAEVLASEFGAEPSPETQALAAGVRNRARPYGDRGAPSPGPTPGTRGRSVVVLPFDDLGDGTGGTLAEGLAEEVRTALAKLHGVRVLSRTSSRPFTEDRPPSMRVVRDRLGVDLALEGSVRLDRERVRVTVHLVDTEHDDSLWAESFDGPARDLLHLQGTVGLRVARALAVELSPRDHRRLRRPATSNLEAYRLYLEGQEQLARRRPDQAARAADLFRRALDLDEAFPHAWTGLADSFLIRAATGSEPYREAGLQGRAAIERALRVDPDLGEARATLGMLQLFWEHDLSGAGRELRRAVELSPGYATARQWFGQWLAVMSRGEEGMAHVETALRLDPLSPAVQEGVGKTLWLLGRNAEAASRLRSTLDHAPEYWRARAPLAAVSAAAGDLAAAATELLRMWEAGAYGAPLGETRRARSALNRSPADALDAMLAGVRSRLDHTPGARPTELLLLMLLDRHTEALRALEAASRDGTIGLAVDYAPVFDPLAVDHRFRDLMDRNGLLLPRWAEGGAARGGTSVRKTS